MASQNQPFPNTIDTLSFPTIQNSSEGKISINMPGKSDYSNQTVYLKSNHKLIIVKINYF